MTAPTTGEPVRCKSCDAPLDFGDKFVDWSALRVNRHHDEFVCLNATIRERNALRADLARVTAERDAAVKERNSAHEGWDHNHTLRVEAEEQLATAQREAAGRDARALALIQRMRRFMPVPGEFPGETRIRMSEWEPLIVEIEAVEEALTPAPEAGR